MIIATLFLFLGTSKSDTFHLLSNMKLDPIFKWSSDQDYQLLNCLIIDQVDQVKHQEDHVY